MACIRASLSRPRLQKIKIRLICLKCRYKGPHLLDAIDSFRTPSRDFSKPLHMPICDVIKLPSLGQVSACGKLEAGALRSGSKVLVNH